MWTCYRRNRSKSLHKLMEEDKFKLKIFNQKLIILLLENIFKLQASPSDYNKYENNKKELMKKYEIQSWM